MPRSASSSGGRQDVRRIRVAAQRQDGVMLQQQQRVRDVTGGARRHQRVLAIPGRLVADPPQPFGPQVHRPRTIAGPTSPRSYDGMIWRSANSTLAGRSASRRMYHGYQNSP